MEGVSSMNRRASERRPAAVVSLGQSDSPRNPLRIFWESTRASEESMRMASCSLAISSEKTATGTPSSTEQYWAMLRAKAVLPMLGRPAMMTRSERCRPEVISSSFVKPVATPVISSFLS